MLLSSGAKGEHSCNPSTWKLAGSEVAWATEGNTCFRNKWFISGEDAEEDNGDHAKVVKEGHTRKVIGLETWPKNGPKGSRGCQ